MSTGPILDASTMRNIKAQGFLNGIALLTATTQGNATGAAQLSWGTGAPNHTAAQGSVFIRTDAADSDTLFYRNTDGATTWETVVGSEVTELLAATNAWTGANTFSHASGVTSNTITERTAAAGVTVDETLIKDGGATLKDSTTFIADEADATKKIAFQASGIATGTTRTLAMPDADVTITTAAATILDDATVGAIRDTLLVDPVAIGDISVAAEAGNAIAVTIQLRDLAWATLAREQSFLVEFACSEAQVTFTAATTGTLVSAAGATVIATADATGLLVLTLTDGSAAFAGTGRLLVTPVMIAGAGRYTGSPSLTTATFA